MIKPILQIGDPILSLETKKVADFKSPELKQLVADLIDTADSKRAITAGLAAPQIGSQMSVCICRRVDLEKDTTAQLSKEALWEVVINPEIVKQSKSTSIFWEACMSVGVGKNALFGPVERPNTVTVKYQDRDGKLRSISARGFFAHELQHEIDHLSGILFLKYISNPKNIWKRDAIDKYYDEFETYPPIE